MSDLVSHFENLGDNCEFGFVQRAAGHEEGGLFRWALVSGVAPLIAGLETGFAGIFAFDRLTSAGAGTMVFDAGSGIAFHTRMRATLTHGRWVFDHDEAERREIHAEEADKLAYLVAKFRVTLAEGRKILVFKRNDGVSHPDALRLHAALARHGAARLLYVTRAREGEAPGTVRAVAPGLYHGLIDRFAPYDRADDVSLDVWLSICRNALAC